MFLFTDGNFIDLKKKVAGYCLLAGSTRQLKIQSLLTSIHFPGLLAFTLSSYMASQYTVGR
jgi:hypothetical protein